MKNFGKKKSPEGLEMRKKKVFPASERRKEIWST
jgi:hypothetical protein